MKDNWLQKFFRDYILVQAETCLGIGIIGSIFAKDVMVPFKYFFLPALLGFFYMLPCVVLYLKEDLSIKWIYVERVVELIVIELATLWGVYFIFGNHVSKNVYLGFAISIALFDFLTYFISDYLESREVKALNKRLKPHFDEDD